MRDAITIIVASLVMILTPFLTVLASAAALEFIARHRRFSIRDLFVLTTAVAVVAAIIAALFR